MSWAFDNSLSALTFFISVECCSWWTCYMLLLDMSLPPPPSKKGYIIFESLTFNFLTLLWDNYYRAICSIEVDNYVEIVTKCIIYVWKKNGVRLINNKQVMSAVLQNMVMKPWLFLCLVGSDSNDRKNEG